MDRLRKHHGGTFNHSLRVSQLCFQVASKAGMPVDTCTSAMRAGLLHDIGKLFIPASILSKPEALTPAEYDQVKQHVSQGAYLLKKMSYDAHIVDAVLNHHEREDGSGYPGGIKVVSPFARLVAVCDVFDAMTEDREYKSALEKDYVLGLMMEGCVGALFMPYVHILYEVVKRGEVAFG